MHKYLTLLGTSLIIFLAFFVVFAQIPAKATSVDTGDANAYSCTENLINTDNYLPWLAWFNTNCVNPSPTATPTVTITPTPTIDPCGDNGELCATPTVTPTPVPSTNNGGGSNGGDGRSDGLSSCPSCTQAPKSPTQAVLGASTGPIKAVLGLSTTSGEESALPGIFQIFGALTSAGLGFIFLKKNA